MYITKSWLRGCLLGTKQAPYCIFLLIDSKNTFSFFVCISMDNAKGFKVCMLNIRSLWQNVDELRLHFADYDVLGVCETWLNPSIPSQMISLYNHKIFRQDRDTGRRGGGLVLYVANRLFEFSCVLEDYCSTSLDLEQLWISIDEPNSRKKVIGLVYRPPSGNVEASLAQLRESLEKIQVNQNCETTVMGDLNIDYKTRNSTSFKLLKEIERDFGLRQLIKDPSRITVRSSTLIDLMLTDCMHVSTSVVFDICISDHLPIYYVRKKPRERNPKKVIYGRSYKKYVVEDYQTDITDDVRWGSFWKSEPW